MKVISILLALQITGGTLIAQPDDRWQYPIRLGDPLAKVHRLLGNATRTTGVLEEYPVSGVTVWFDSENRVTKLNFEGAAGAIYAKANAEWIPSERPVVFGLSGNVNEGKFRRVLGLPLREENERRAEIREVRLLWKKDGYLIDALFLDTVRAFDRKTLAKGTLLWFEVSAAL